MSGATSAQYGVPCPTCGAGPYAPCRSLTTRRVTDTHAARWQSAPYPRPARPNPEATA